MTWLIVGSSRVPRSAFRRPRAHRIGARARSRALAKNRGRGCTRSSRSWARADHLGLRPGTRKPRHRVDASRLDAARRGVADYHRVRADRRGVRAANEDQGGARPSDDGRRRAVGVRSSARERGAARRRAVRRLPRLGHRHVRHPTHPRPGGRHDVSARHASRKTRSPSSPASSFRSASRCSCTGR